MRALHLDFLHPATTRFGLGMGLLVLGIIGAVAAAGRYYAIATELEELGASVADAKRLARRDLPQIRGLSGDPKLAAQEVGRANAVLASLTVPWDAMFSELEAAASADVALLGIQPDGSGRQVKVAGEARRFEDLLTYIGRLEATEGFAHVFLAGHEMKPEGRGRGVAFTLVADWVGRQ